MSWWDFSWVSSAFSSVGSFLPDFSSSISDSLNVFTDIPKAIMGGLTALGSFFVSALQFLANRIFDIGSYIADKFTSAYSIIMNYIYTAINNFASSVYNSIYQFGQYIYSMIIQAYQIVKNITRTVINILQTIYNKILELLRNILNYIKTMINTATNVLNNFLRNLASTILDKIEKLMAYNAMLFTLKKDLNEGKLSFTTPIKILGTGIITEAIIHSLRGGL